MPNAPTAPVDPALSDILADFTVAPVVRAKYTVGENARRAPVKAIHETAYVTRGTDVAGTPALFVQNGTRQDGLALCAVGQALAHGVITPQELIALSGGTLKLA
jgi:hypothetical protein